MIKKTNKDNCLFCQIIKGEKPSQKIIENDDVYAFLDIYPASKGHTLVIPKNHSLNLLDTKDSDLCQVYKMVKKLCLHYQQILKVDDFLVKSHNGKLAGQEIDHFHVHIIPCYTAATRNSPREKLSTQELENIQKNITSQLT